MLTAHIITVAKAETTPLTKTFFCGSLVLFSFWLRSHTPKTIATVLRTTNDVTASPCKKTANKRLNSGYIHVIGTARATPIRFKLIMYNVSPKPKPIIPLMPARTAACKGKSVKTPNLPITAKQITKAMLVHTQRTMFAEMGFALDNASLYSTADIVQQIAAPKAASSPIIVRPFR